MKARIESALFNVEFLEDGHSSVEMVRRVGEATEVEDETVVEGGGAGACYGEFGGCDLRVLICL